ncbi:MAG: YabP/YqfC family sporulation protein [Clostridiales bacterium]|jgi:sporulation protein YabP|nr:YabP/YqfC family sporulation protein [Clostridiales bacterium]
MTDGQKNAAPKRPHTLQMEQNSRLCIGGVLGVKSYNEKEISLILSDYILVINGEGLNIGKLNIDEGSVAAEGIILSLRYLKSLEKGGFLKRLAK